MKVIIFIGHHKVGSTSLQAFLAANAWKLKQNGILYPSLRSYGLLESPRLAARFIAQAALRRTPLPSMGINAREPHNALAFKLLEEANGNRVPFHRRVPPSSRIFSDIMTQVSNTQPDTLILCGEVFSNFSPRKTQLIERVKSEFAGCDFQIMCTLRRVDQHLVSWHGQRIKFGHKVEPLHRAVNKMYMQGIHVNYQRMLEGWRTCFPDARFVVRNYAETLKSGGSIKDFMSNSGIAFPGYMLMLPDRNPSLPLACYEICRQLNLKLRPAIARKKSREIAALCRSENIALAKDIEMFGRVNREKLFTTFTPVSQYLNQFAVSSPFFDDLDDILELNPVSEVSAALSVKNQLLASSKTSSKLTKMLERLQLDACIESRKRL